MVEFLPTHPHLARVWQRLSVRVQAFRLREARGRLCLLEQVARRGPGDSERAAVRKLGSRMDRASFRRYHDRIVLETAQSCIEALVRVGSLMPDVFVLDVAKDGMDGLEVLKRLKATTATAGLQVVLLAGKVTAELQKKATAAGTLALVTKPLSADSLVEVVLGRGGAGAL